MLLPIPGPGTKFATSPSNSENMRATLPIPQAVPGSKPWFAEPHEERLQLSKESERNDKDAKLKDSMDPMKIMKHYVNLKCGLQENGKKIAKLKELTTASERHRLYKKKSKKVGKTLEEMRADRLLV
uniref:Uncharacterized protein n=1 Tax=Ixodes ricinus TaxID=34613 RepID=A0A0K8RBX3_IXORI